MAWWVVASIGAALLARPNRRTAPLEPASDHAISYLKHLHSYVYDLKHEAEARARALVTATALYVAAAGFVVKTASELSATSHGTQHATALLAVFAGLGGAVISVVSLLQAILVFWPRISDATSPMEPLEITRAPLSALMQRHRGYTPDDVVAALTREIHAVADVQIRRSGALGRSAATFIVAVLCLLIAACMLLVSFAIQ